jgi:hypothetical protein
MRLPGSKCSLAWAVALAGPTGAVAIGNGACGEGTSVATARPPAASSCSVAGSICSKFAWRSSCHRWALETGKQMVQEDGQTVNVFNVRRRLSASHHRHIKLMTDACAEKEKSGSEFSLHRYR